MNKEMRHAPNKENIHLFIECNNVYLMSEHGVNWMLNLASKDTFSCIP